MPERVGRRHPVFGIGRRFIAEVVNAFRTLVVGVDSARILDHLPEKFRILQHGAGPQHIVVKRLSVMVRHEQRAL